MIRVGFYYSGSNWLGGVNYLWNLLHSIQTHKHHEMSCVLLVHTIQDAAHFASIPSLEVQMIGRTSKVEFAINKIGTHVLGVNFQLAKAVKEHKIDLMSHSGFLGWNFPVPYITWIPDFQHVRLPENFSRLERFKRDRYFNNCLIHSSAVIVSSGDASGDFLKFSKYEYADKCKVLRFASQPRFNEEYILPLDLLRKKFNLPKKYIFLPNQFWRHKNHLTVLESLREVAKSGQAVTIVATGLGHDSRSPRHYEMIKDFSSRNNLNDQFQHLGVVSFQEMISLMQHSLCVLNPSLFEGWSTTVEEAKSLGKRIILSDIPVHREQNPANALFFPPLDAEKLARLILQVWHMEEAQACPVTAEDLAKDLGERTEVFAETFASIVKSVLKSTKDLKYAFVS